MDSKDDMNLAYVGCIGCHEGTTLASAHGGGNKGQLAGPHRLRAGLQLFQGPHGKTSECDSSRHGIWTQTRLIL